MMNLIKTFCVLGVISVSVTQAASVDTTNKFDPGKLLLTTMPGISPTTSTLEFVTKRIPKKNDECNNGSELEIIEGVKLLTMNVSSIGQFYSCSNAREATWASNRYFPAQCQKNVSCRLSVKNSLTGNMSEADLILNQAIAKDYALGSLSLYGDKMEQLENLKNFAQKKFKTNLGSQCIERFSKQDFKTCNSRFIEEAFEEKQKTCAFGVGCYVLDNTEKEIESYGSFKNKNPKKGPRDYFAYRIKKTSDKALDEDDDKISKLAEAVTSSAYKKLTGENRAIFIVSAIGLDLDGRLNDPILGFDLGNKNKIEHLKTNDRINEIVKILESKDITKESFVEKFDQFRKKRAEVLLGNNKVCGESPSFAKICKNTTTLLKGEKIKMDSMTADAVTSKNLRNKAMTESLKRALGESFHEDDTEVLLNAQRCILFGVTSANGVFAGDNKPDPGNSDDGDIDQGTKGSRTDRQMAGFGPSANDVKSGPEFDSDKLMGSAGMNAKVVSDREPSGEAIEGIKGVTADEVGSVLQPGVQTNPINNYNDMFASSSFDAFADKKGLQPDTQEQKPEEAQSQTPAAGSNDKLNDYLMKKLADAEANLEKMKADGEAAEADRAKQKKIDEEAALIKDLKSQIADLKTQTAKATAKTAEQPAAVQSKSQSSSSSSGSDAKIIASASRGESAAAKAVASESYESAPATSGSSSSNKSFSSSNNSGPVLTSVSNSDGSKTTTLASGLVLTTIDGMTTEKAAQTISNRIIELNGTPFYIEEGGMVKEVIAVIKDGKVLLDENGKPIYEKIVKGKVGDKKFAKVKDSKRAPASITDSADLKRAEEEKAKRERAEYMKLKSLTNEALKKK